jgi:hypothetical protein
MTAKYRLYTYIIAMVMSIAVGGLILFGVVDASAVPAAVGAVGLVFAGVFGMAAKNVRD